MRLYPIAKTVKVGTVLYRCSVFDNDESEEYKTTVSVEPYLVKNINKNGFYLTLNTNESYLKQYKNLVWGKWPVLFKGKSNKSELQDEFGYHPTKLRALQVNLYYLLSKSNEYQEEHSKAIKTLKRMISSEKKKNQNN